MPQTAIYLKGAIEPLILNESFQATSATLNAAAGNFLFFQSTDTEGRPTSISIPNIIYLQAEGDD